MDTLATTIAGFDHPVLTYTFLGNSFRNWIMAFVVIAAIFAAVKLYSVYIKVRLRAMALKTETLLDDFLLENIDRVVTPCLAAFSFYILTQLLVFHSLVNRVAYYLLIIVVTFYAISTILRLFDFFAKSLSKQPDGSKIDAHALNNIRIFVKLSMWLIGILLILKNLGYEITSLLAGLGIAGIAVALAIQNILGDLFSYVSILIDKPFEVGDFVIVGSDLGVVEYIGIRSTRLRTLQGQELVVSNADLTSSRINNYKKMAQRRIVFKVGVIYGTPRKKLEAIAGWIREIIDATPNVHCDRAHFQAFGAFSLDFEMVYFVHSSDYNDYMDAQQAINLAIYKKFEEEGVEFAFPTQTLHVLQEMSNAAQQSDMAPKTN